MGFGSGRLSYKTEKGRVSIPFSESMQTQDFELELVKAPVDGEERLTVVLTPRAELIITECFINTDESLQSEDTVFLNGYQTWTDSGEFKIGQSIPKLSPLAKPLIGMYGDYSFYKYGRGNLQSWTYSYIRSGSAQTVKLYGSLSEKTGYTIFEYNKNESSMRIIKDCEGLELPAGISYVLFDLFSVTADEETAFDRYFEAAGISKPKVSTCTGWTSWYNYYTKVTQDDVLENLEAFSSRKLPIDIFQIDDGFQDAVGDWLSINDKFSKGMGYLADEIHKAGYKAGLWLAPIICEKRSRIFKEHPDWVASRAGFNPGWSGVFYTLDFYNPEVQQYLREVFDTVLNKWNYDMVKLDFLYAAALPKRKDKTRGQVMCEFFEFLREISGDKIILGCGAPLGPAFGLFDYCRVSSDVALTWEDRFLSSIHYRERVSTFNALISTIGRHRLNGRAFYNDPDVFILRDSNNKLTDDQKYTLFKINSILGGLVFTSDNINDYDEKQMELLKSLLSAEPKKVASVEKSDVVRIIYNEGNAELCLISNLSAEKKTAQMPFGGELYEEKRSVSEKEEITLRPYQTLSLRRSEG